MLCAIWYHLCNSKNVKTTREGVVLLVKLQAASQISLQPQQIDHLILCLDTPLICLFLSLHNSYTYTLPVSVYLCTALIHSTLAKLTDDRITACTFFNSLKFWRLPLHKSCHVSKNRNFIFRFFNISWCLGSKHFWATFNFPKISVKQHSHCLTSWNNLLIPECHCSYVAFHLQTAELYFREFCYNMRIAINLFQVLSVIFALGMQLKNMRTTLKIYYQQDMI